MLRVTGSFESFDFNRNSVLPLHPSVDNTIAGGYEPRRIDPDDKYVYHQ